MFKARADLNQEPTVWIAEIDGRAVAKLSNPRFYEMFWSYWSVEALSDCECDVIRIYESAEDVSFRDTANGIEVCTFPSAAYREEDFRLKDVNLKRILMRGG